MPAATNTADRPVRGGAFFTSPLYCSGGKLRFALRSGAFTPL
jgi:hypothetical protein